MFSSEENTHQPRISQTAHLRGYIIARGNTHQPRINTATQCGCLRASGASQMGNPLHDEYVFPVLPVPTASRSLLGRVSPYWWEVPTHCPDSSSRCVRPAEIGSQLGQYPSQTTRTASCASDTQSMIRNYTIYTFHSNNISYNTIAGRLGCFIG